MCYDSDHCTFCAPGYERVAKERVGCNKICCAVGSPGPFWYDRCFDECPAGFSSVLKAPHCWDLCVPYNQSYEGRMGLLTTVPTSDKRLRATSPMHAAIITGIEVIATIAQGVAEVASKRR